MTAFIPTTPIPETYAEQAEAMARVLYSSWVDQYPGAVVTFCGDKLGHDGRTSGFGRVETLPIADPGAIAHAALSTSGPEANGWVNSQIQTSAPTSGRGDRACHQGFTALMLDLDTRRKADSEDMPTGHKVVDKGSLTLPTLGDASRIVDRVCREVVGVMPTAVVQTSDEGVHIWWKLDRLVPTDDPMMLAWKSMWEQEFAGEGFHIDLSVIADVSRVLRLPGQWRVKANGRNSAHWSKSRREAASAEDIARAAAYPQTTVPQQARLVRWNPELSIDPEELASRLPQTPVRTTQASVPTSAPARAYEPSAAERELDDAMPPLALMDAVLDGELVSGDGYGDGDTWHWCNASTPVSCTQHVQDEEQLVFVHSETMLSDLDLHPSSGTARKLTASSFVRWVAGPNAAALIERLAAEDDKPTFWQSLGIPVISAGDDLSEWRARVTEVLTAREVTPEAVQQDTERDLFAAVSHKAARQQEALFTVTAGGRVIDGEESGTWRIIIGGPDHGSYRVKVGVVHEPKGVTVGTGHLERVLKRTPRADGDGSDVELERLDRISNAVIVRTAQHRLMRTVDDREPVTYDVTVVTPIGRAVVRELPPEHSIDPAKVLPLANVGGLIPDWNGSREMKNLIAATAVTAQEHHLSFARSGWSDEAGEVRYVTTANSLSASGVEESVGCDVSADDVMTRLGDMPSQADFQHLPGLLREAQALVPGAPVIAAGLIMHAVSAPLRVTGPNATIWLTGKTGSGKTRLSFLATMWAQGGRGAPWERSAVDMKDISRQAVTQVARMHGDVVSLFDDIRTGDDDGASFKEQLKFARKLIGAAHERRGRTVAGPDQRTRSAGRYDCSPVITSEVFFEGNENSMAAKMIVMPEVRQDLIDFDPVPMTDLDGNPVIGFDGKQVMRYRSNAFYERYAPVANRVFTGYMAWLREDIERRAGGNLAAWAELNEGDRQDIASRLPANRTLQVVARLVAGWQKFAHFVSEQSGVELPDWSSYGPVMLDSANAAIETQTEEFALRAAIVSALETQRGHLVSGTGMQPHRSIATSVGWADRGGQSLSPCGPRLGWISDDGNWVVISTAQAREVQPHITTAALARTLTSLAPEEDRKLYERGTGAPRHSKGFGAQVRGWRIRTRDIGLSLADAVLDEDEEAADF